MILDWYNYCSITPVLFVFTKVYCKLQQCHFCLALRMFALRKHKSTSIYIESENESEQEVTVSCKKHGFGKAKNIYANIYKDSTKRYPGIWFLLLRWKGSIYKLLWLDFTIFFSIYVLLSLNYRFILMNYPAYRQAFELFCVFSERFSNSLPITFLIGLYVSQVVDRWWSQFMLLPFPDQLAMKLVAFIPGKVTTKSNSEI